MFKQTINQTPIYTITDNGAKTHQTTGDVNLNFFFLAGASRGKNILESFWPAMGQNEEKAVRTALWMRDCRGGAGERESFRTILKSLHENGYYSVVNKILPLVPILGRWDDLLVLRTDEVRDMIWAALADQNKLCAKWMPRQGPVAHWLAKNYTPKYWRKMVVSLSNTVEQLMCSGKWNEIEFKKVPSLASARYQNAFKLHCPHYEEYKKALVKGETTIHGDVIYPHDVIKAFYNGDKTVAQAQWNALPNYMPENYSVLPVVDVSGSMTIEISKGTRALDVALALGLYCSDKLTGAFKDVVCTFSDKSQLYVLQGALEVKLNILLKMNWGMNTNLDAAFQNILRHALVHKLEEKDMPKCLLVISDMEFDACANGTTNFKNLKDLYKQAGYELPNVVFWNVQGRTGNTPVRLHKTGTALISGFSPAILTTVLKGDRLDPMSIMNTTIMSDRYKFN